MDLEVDGRRVFLADHGKGIDPDRPTVLFLHGAGIDHSIWPLQARHFAYRGWNALAPDLPGHGRSALLDEAGTVLTSIGDMALWLVSLLDAAGLDRVHLVGHSMGALAALEVSARARARVANLILIGAAPAMPVNAELLEQAGRPQGSAPGLICDWGFGPAGHFGGHRAPGSWMLGHGLALLERSSGALLQADLNACNAYHEGATAAAAVRCPTLVLSGQLDRMTPARAGAQLADAISGARQLVLAGAGHMMMIEQPDQTLDALAGFLEPS